MIELLKLKIEYHLGREVRTRGDCEELSSLIEERTGMFLSYNTLRRFFGIDPQKVRTRMSTLNILSKYLSYLSYQHFVEQIPEEQNRLFNLQLAHVIHRENPSASVDFLKAHRTNRIRFTEIVIQAISHFLMRKKSMELIEFIEQAQLEEEHFSYDEKLYIGNSIGIVLRTAPLPRTHFKRLLQSPFFNVMVFEIFVDYSSLRGFVKAFARHPAVHTSQLFFKEGLHRLIQFIELKPIVPRRKIKDIRPDIHPILLGRMASLPLYETHPERLAASHLMQWKAHFSLDFFYEPTVATILSGNFTLYSIIAAEVSKLQKQVRFHEMHYIHVAELMNCCYLYKLGDTARALDRWGKIDCRYFRLSYKDLLELFYFTLGAKLTHEPGFLDQAYHLADRLQYPRYNRDFIEAY